MWRCKITGYDKAGRDFFKKSFCCEIMSRKEEVEDRKIPEIRSIRGLDTLSELVQRRRYIYRSELKKALSDYHYLRFEHESRPKSMSVIRRFLRWLHCDTTIDLFTAVISGNIHLV